MSFWRLSLMPMWQVLCPPSHLFIPIIDLLYSPLSSNTSSAIRAPFPSFHITLQGKEESSGNCIPTEAYQAPRWTNGDLRELLPLNSICLNLHGYSPVIFKQSCTFMFTRATTSLEAHGWLERIGFRFRSMCFLYSGWTIICNAFELKTKSSLLSYFMSLLTMCVGE